MSRMRWWLPTMRDHREVSLDGQMPTHVSRRQALAGVSALGGMALLGSALRRPAFAQSGDSHDRHSLQPQPGATPSWLSYEPSELIEPEPWQ